MRTFSLLVFAGMFAAQVCAAETNVQHKCSYREWTGSRLVFCDKEACAWSLDHPGQPRMYLCEKHAEEWK